MSTGKPEDLRETARWEASKRGVAFHEVVEQIEERRRRWVPFLVTVVCTVLIASGFTVVYVGRTVQQMCGLIGLLSDENPPPQTERGKAQVREAQKLGKQFRC